MMEIYFAVAPGKLLLNGNDGYYSAMNGTGGQSGPPRSFCFLSHFMHWNCGRRCFDLTHRGVIMGILNVTPDSFSDGGRWRDPQIALGHALSMVEAGAEIIDIGGESTRPGAGVVDAAEETARVLPIIRALRERTDALISIDTMKACVAREACAAGADIINDVSGLQDPEMAATAAHFRTGLVIMHMQGRPRTMQQAPVYHDVLAEVRDALSTGVAQALAAGLPLEFMALDPGIGFGKTTEHNLELLRHLDSISSHGRPVMLGVSRKSLIGKLLGNMDPVRRDWPTAALTSWTWHKGARIHRVHDVRASTDALRMAEAISGSGL